MKHDDLIRTFVSCLIDRSNTGDVSKCPFLLIEEHTNQFGPEAVAFGEILSVLDLVFESSIPSWRCKSFDEVHLRRSYLRGFLSWHQRHRPKDRAVIALIEEELDEATSLQAPPLGTSH